MNPQLRKRRRRGRRRRRVRRWVVALVATAVILMLPAAVVGVTAYVHRAPDSRLIGTWQSDGDATIAELKKTQSITDAQEKELRKIFGKWKVTFTATAVTVDYGDGTSDAQPYRVVSKDDDSAAVNWYFQPSQRDALFLIFFESADVHWLDVPGFRMRECFRRVR